MAGRTRQEEPVVDYVNIELRIGSRRGPGGGPGGGHNGRKGWPAYEGAVPRTFLVHFARLTARGVPNNHAALYVYAQDETDPDQPEVIPEWNLKFTSVAAMTETSFEDAELAAGQDGLRQISVAKTALEQEMELQRARKLMFEEQTRDAEARCILVREQSDRLQRQFLEEQGRINRQLAEEQERANRIIKDLDLHVSDKRALANEEEAMLNNRVEQAIERLGTQLAGLATVTDTMMAHETANLSMMEARKEAGMQTFQRDLNLIEEATATTIAAKRADPLMPSPSAKLADSFAGFIEKGIVPNVPTLLGLAAAWLTGKPPVVPPADPPAD